MTTSDVFGVAQPYTGSNPQDQMYFFLANLGEEEMAQRSDETDEQYWTRRGRFPQPSTVDIKIGRRDSERVDLSDFIKSFPVLETTEANLSETIERARQLVHRTTGRGAADHVLTNPTTEGRGLEVEPCPHIARDEFFVTYAKNAMDRGWLALGDGTIIRNRNWESYAVRVRVTDAQSKPNPFELPVGVPQKVKDAMRDPASVQTLLFEPWQPGPEYYFLTVTYDDNSRLAVKIVGETDRKAESLKSYMSGDRISPEHKRIEQIRHFLFNDLKITVEETHSRQTLPFAIRRGASLIAAMSRRGCGNVLLVHSLDEVPADLHWEENTRGVIEVSPYVRKGEFLILYSNAAIDRGWVFIDNERYIKNPWGADKYVRMVRFLDEE